PRHPGAPGPARPPHGPPPRPPRPRRTDAALCSLARGDERAPADERDAAQQNSDLANRFTPIDRVSVLRFRHWASPSPSNQRLLRLSSLTAKSAARAVSAMYVSDGF